MSKLTGALFAVLALGCGFVEPAIAAPKRSVRNRPADQTFTGSVVSENGKFSMVDETKKVNVELVGGKPAKFVGKRVRVTGQIVSSLSSGHLVLAVNTMRVAAGVAAATTGGTVATAAAVKAGMSTAAIVGATAAGTAATVGGLYAADVIGTEEKPASRP